MQTVRVKPIIIEIPLTPPTVNHYKVPVTIRTSKGPVKTYALTPEAKAFHAAVAIFAKGASLIPATPAERLKIRYSLTATVFLGVKERGDGDNFWKCLADGLVLAGVIHSDAKVRSWHIEVEDEQRHNPRTLICVGVVNKTQTLAEQMRDESLGGYFGPSPIR